MEDSPEGRKASNETYLMYKEKEKAPTQPRVRARNAASSSTQQLTIEYTIADTKIKLGKDTKYRNAESRSSSFYQSLTLGTLNHQHILINIDGTWTLFIADQVNKTLKYGKRKAAQRGFTFEEGSKDEAEKDGEAIYEPTRRDLADIINATDRLEPTIYCLPQEDIKKADNCTIDRKNGLEDSYIKKRLREFTTLIKRHKTYKGEELSIAKAEDIEKVALLDKYALHGANYWGSYEGPVQNTRSKGTEQFYSLYMKKKGSSNFVLIDFDFDQFNDKLKINVRDDNSVRDQLEATILSGIAQQQPESSSFWRVDQLQGKKGIKQLDMLADFFGTEKTSVTFEDAKSSPGLYITKLESSKQWNLHEYFEIPPTGMGILVYISENGKSLICKPTHTTKPLNELGIDDVQTASIDDAKKSFAELIKGIIRGIKVKYDEKEETRPEVVKDYLTALLSSEALRKAKVFGFKIGEKDGNPLYDPVKIQSSKDDIIIAEQTDVTDKNPAKKYFDLNRLCIDGQSADSAFVAKPKIKLDGDNNPTDEDVTFEDQVKILLQFFLEGTQHPTPKVPYNQRIVLHGDKLDKWEVGSTEAFLENKDNQYICARDSYYIRDKSTINVLRTKFADSDELSKKSLNNILAAMFWTKIVISKNKSERPMKDYFTIFTRPNDPSTIFVINSAIGWIARQNPKYATKYPEQRFTISDKTYKITKVSGNTVEFEEVK